MVYKLMKFVFLGPLLRLFVPVQGDRCRVHPRRGRRDPGRQSRVGGRLLLHPAVHQAPGDLPGQERVLHREGRQGRLKKAFFSGMGQVPVDRSGATAARAALDTGIRLLKEGHMLGIYPEGTRSPDGQLYKGKTGVARMALEAGRPGRPGRHDRHREGQSDRVEDLAARPHQDGHRPPAGLLPVRGHGRRPLRRAVDDRRDHVPADGALRPGVRGRVRGQGQGGPRRRGGGTLGGRRRSRVAVRARSPACPAPRPAEPPLVGPDPAGSGGALLLRLRVHRGRPHHRVDLDRRHRTGRARVLRGVHRVRPRAGQRVGALARAGQAAVAGRSGVAVQVRDPGRPVRVPDGARPAGRVVGLVRRLRPRGARPAVGRDARVAPGRAAADPGDPAALGSRRMPTDPRTRHRPARRAGRRAPGVRAVAGGAGRADRGRGKARSTPAAIARCGRSWDGSRSLLGLSSKSA